jgi:MFS transporter, DHA1 family, multidrug resistance protein
LTAVLDRLILKVPSAGHLDESGQESSTATLKEPAHAN